MRSIWRGALSFGLVNIPVRLYSASDDHGLKFNYLHEKDLSPIKYARVCRKEGEEVPYEEIVKGYEYRKGDYIVLTDEDFEKANVKKTKSIDITEFVKESEVDSIYYDKPYYLEPEKGSEKPYALLREALRRSKKVAVAKFVLRNKEHLGVVKPHDQVIVLEQLRFAGDIRDTGALNLPGKRAAEKRELDMALSLIDQLTKHFKPEEFKDTYTEELKEVIKERALGKKPAERGAEPEPTPVADLMSALRASLEKEKAKQKS